MENIIEKNMIKVCCAVIENEGEILAAQRSENMKLPLKWEFPGGKMEEDETAEQCIVREIREELGVVITVICNLPETVYSYKNNVIKLIPFVCRIIEGTVENKEHKSILWNKAENFENLDWAEADIFIYNEYMRHKNELC
jgi:8-oxo-dGTP diphosphatase